MWFTRSKPCVSRSCELRTRKSWKRVYAKSRVYRNGYRGSYAEPYVHENVCFHFKTCVLIKRVFAKTCVSRNRVFQQRVFQFEAVCFTHENVRMCVLINVWIRIGCTATRSCVSRNRLFQYNVCVQKLVNWYRVYVKTCVSIWNHMFYENVCVNLRVNSNRMYTRSFVSRTRVFQYNVCFQKRVYWNRM